MSTAKVLGQYRDDLQAAGFTREEAMVLVGHAAPMGHVSPMDTTGLDTTPDPEPTQGVPLQVMVIAGSHEEATRWVTPMAAACGPGVHFVASAGVSPPHGMAGPMVLVELPGADRLPEGVREAWRDTVRMANLKMHGA